MLTLSIPAELLQHTWLFPIWKTGGKKLWGWQLQRNSRYSSPWNLHELCLQTWVICYHSWITITLILCSDSIDCVGEFTFTLDLQKNCDLFIDCKLCEQVSKWYCYTTKIISHFRINGTEWSWSVSESGTRNNNWAINSTPTRVSFLWFCFNFLLALDWK